MSTSLLYQKGIENLKIQIGGQYTTQMIQEAESYRIHKWWW